MSEPPIQQEAHRLWIPGDQLEPPADNINPELVREAFRLHVAQPEDEVVSLGEDSLSALIPPRRMPRGFLFVDIHDCLGDLSGSLQAIQHSDVKKPWERVNNHDYGENMFFTDEETVTKQALIYLVTRSEAGMRPAPDIDMIRRRLINLRAKRVYTCFLSVSTPGNELPTISNFLGRYLQYAGDGVVHIKGDYREADKGVAATEVMKFVEKQTGQQIPPGTPVAAIDDWPNHLNKIRNSINSLGRNLNLETIQHTFPSGQPADKASIQKDSALGCVEQAYALF